MMSEDSILIKGGAGAITDARTDIIKRAGGVWDQSNQGWKCNISQYEDLKRQLDISGIETQGIPDIARTSVVPIGEKLQFSFSKRKISIEYTPEDGNKTIENSIPSEIAKELYDFQKEGIQFGLKNLGRVLIADEMGVGKTIQAICLASCFRKAWPLVVMCPSSLKYNWKDEILKWEPSLRESQVQIIVKAADDIFHNTQVLICSYDIIPKIESKLIRLQPNIAIADEAHYLKNPVAKRTVAIVPLLQQLKHVILLTGTPAFARPKEMFTLLSIIRPDIYKAFKSFGDRYCDPKPAAFGMGKDYLGSSNEKELHYMLKKTIMIRRLKSEVLSQLPKKRRKKVIVNVDTSILKEIQSILKQTNKSSLESLFEAVRSTRPLTAEESGAQNFQAESIFSALQLCYRLSGLAKLAELKNYIQDLLENDLKVIIFAHHREMLDALESFVRADLSLNSIRIDGMVSAKDRHERVQAFQTDAQIRVAILSLAAAGSGLTLTASSNIVFAEMHWTPAIIQQAEDRAHRIGQENSVLCHYIIGEKTLDDLLYKKIDQKIAIVSNILDGQKKVLHMDSTQAANGEIIEHEEIENIASLEEEGEGEHGQVILDEIVEIEQTMQQQQFQTEEHPAVQIQEEEASVHYATADEKDDIEDIEEEQKQEHRQPADECSKQKEDNNLTNVHPYFNIPDIESDSSSEDEFLLSIVANQKEINAQKQQQQEDQLLEHKQVDSSSVVPKHSIKFNSQKVTSPSKKSASGTSLSVISHIEAFLDDNDDSDISPATSVTKLTKNNTSKSPVKQQPQLNYSDVASTYAYESSSKSQSNMKHTLSLIEKYSSGSKPSSENLQKNHEQQQVQQQQQQQSPLYKQFDSDRKQKQTPTSIYASSASPSSVASSSIKKTQKQQTNSPEMDMYHSMLLRSVQRYRSNGKSNSNNSKAAESLAQKIDISSYKVHDYEPKDDIYLYTQKQPNRFADEGSVPSTVARQNNKRSTEKSSTSKENSNTFDDINEFKQQYSRKEQYQVVNTKLYDEAPSSAKKSATEKKSLTYLSKVDEKNLNSFNEDSTMTEEITQHPPRRSFSPLMLKDFSTDFFYLEQALMEEEAEYDCKSEKSEVKAVSCESEKRESIVNRSTSVDKNSKNNNNNKSTPVSTKKKTQSSSSTKKQTPSSSSTKKQQSPARQKLSASAKKQIQQPEQECNESTSPMNEECFDYFENLKLPSSFGTFKRSVETSKTTSQKKDHQSNTTGPMKLLKQ